ncbi:MAG: type II CRISPR-associated endonuclease Cas1 [Lachnospiraceae bacterium]|nr:type II CRISPR-associated endonuclease Cas1 [Lachnospiraceae bacterium]
MICDRQHLPVGLFGAYDNHCRSSKVIGYQINYSTEAYGNLWKEIVEKKILNQAKCYLKLTGDEGGFSQIAAFSEAIGVGDPTNREAHAAKVYFNRLMGTSFSRGDENILLNSGLDYGYAIIRGYIARVCVGYGLNTQIGIHHKSEYNRFNLVDDLMEPFRPFVDMVAYSILKDEMYFKPDHRRILVDLVNRQVLYHDKKMFLGNVIEEYVAQMAARIMGRSENVIFPDIDGFLFRE